MTAEERIKKWKAEGEYAKALVVMSSLYRRKRTKKEICKPYGLTEKELDELLEYDECFKDAFNNKGVTAEKIYMDKAYDNAFGYYKSESRKERDFMNNDGKMVHEVTEKKKFYPGTDQALWYFGSIIMGKKDLDPDSLNREFKKVNKVTCLKPTKKKK